MFIFYYTLLCKRQHPFIVNCGYGTVNLFLDRSETFFSPSLFFSHTKIQTVASPAHIPPHSLSLPPFSPDSLLLPFPFRKEQSPSPPQVIGNPFIHALKLHSARVGMDGMGWGGNKTLLLDCFCSFKTERARKKSSLQSTRYYLLPLY